MNTVFTTTSYFKNEMQMADTNKVNKNIGLDLFFQTFSTKNWVNFINFFQVL